MKRPLWLAAAILFVAGIQTSSAYELTGRVVSVADGDTVTLLDANLRQHRIRLSGIDAPEKRQPFGNRSRLHLGALVFGKQVTADCPKKDRYKRAVCRLDPSLTVPRHISAPPPATARVSGRRGAKNLDTRVVDFSPLIPLPCCACT